MRLQLEALLLVYLLAPGGAALSHNHPQHLELPSSNPAESSDSKTNKERETLRQIQSLVERVFKFQAVTPKVNSLIAFGDFLWSIDQPYAQSLFVKSFDIINAEEERKGPAEDQRRPTPAELSRLRAKVLTHLSRHDPELALKLRELAQHPVEQRDKLRSAINALDQNGSTEQAIKLAERGWDGDLSGSALTLVAFLQKLRRGEPAAADDLYLRTIERVSTQTSANSNDVLTLGTYIYNSHLLASASDPALRDKDGTVLFMKVGDALVVDITADRSGIAPRIVKAYLSTAVNLLSSPTRRPVDPELDAAALQLLFAKAQNSMPEILPTIISRLHLLGAPASNAADESKFAKNTGADVETELVKADDLSGEERDEKLFAAAFTIYQSADFARARAVAAKISDLAGRQKLLNAISFAEAAKRLEANEVVKTEEIADALPVGAARVSLRIAIASFYSKNRNKDRALEVLVAATNECRRLDGDRRKPYLLLAIASATIDVDPISAIAALRESIGSFNGSERLYAEWFDTIQIGSVRREFPLTVKLVDKDLASCIEKLTKAEPDTTMSLLLTLNNESLQGEALVAFSRSIWKREVARR